MRIFEVVIFGEIPQMLSVKCGCGNVDMPPISVCLLPAFIALCFKHT